MKLIKLKFQGPKSYFILYCLKSLGLQYEKGHIEIKNNNNSHLIKYKTMVKIKLKRLLSIEAYKVTLRFLAKNSVLDL